MSHDTLPSTRPSKLRVISKPRIIAGLIAEMDAAQAVIVLRNPQTDQSSSFTLSCDFKIPFETSIITISGRPVIPGTYHVSALFAGQHITFDLQILDENGNCQFPQVMSVVDLRRSRRRSFGPEVQTAEISSANAITLATPIDISHNSMALISAVDDPPLKTGDHVQIKIRGGVTSRDIYGFHMVVQNIDKTRSSTTILLALDEINSRPMAKDERRTERRPIDGVSMSIRPLDEHIGEPLVGTVSDVSLTGLSIAISESTKGNWLTPGLHVRLQNSPVHATIMWRKGIKSGLRLDALDDSKTLNAWFDFLRQLAPSESVHHSQVDELVSLFTESGLLKGSRRKLFGAKPGRFMPPETVTNNPLLYHRVASTIDDGRISGQVSLVRLTDDYWCMQEGTHSGDQRGATYDELLIKVLATARNLSASSALAPRYIGGLVHKTVKSSADFMDRAAAKPGNQKYDSFHLSIRNQDFEVPGIKRNTDLRDIKTMSAASRRNLANLFEPTIFDVFNGGNGSHPRLNAELSQLGPNHEAQTLGIMSDDKYWGLAYRLKSYYSLSSTGVINSVFLVVKQGTEPETIKSGISHLSSAGFTNGTDDLVLIFDGNNPDEGHTDAQSYSQLNSAFKQLKPFSFYILDTLSSLNV